MAEPLVAQDRRHRRRQESIEEILDVAMELMAEQGVAGLSLGEVARQLGIRPPSLYVYFSSKHALYDALFARGALEVLDVARAEGDAALAEEPDLTAVLQRVAERFLRWSIEHRIYAQLLFWRPVPGFEPSAQAYEPAVDLVAYSTGMFATLQGRGWIRADVAADDIMRDWTILIAGVTSQQLANAPDESYETGRFTSAVPSLVDMFVLRYAAPSPSSTTSSTTPRRGRRAHAR